MVSNQKVVITTEYLDYDNIFLKKLAIELPKCSDINKHLIKLELDKLLLYKLIYSLDFIEIKIIKTYIKINLANDFIRPLSF